MITDALRNRALWSAVAGDGRYEELLSYTKRMWERTKTVPIQALSYHDRMLFYRTGDRSRFEAPYFARRNSLSAAALLSLVYPKESEYIDYVNEMLWAICDEYSWALPAHTKGDPDTDYREIDLFNAETAFALAEILVVLGERVDAPVQKRVRNEIKRRIFDPFLSRVYWYESLDSNWAAVCAGCVGGAMLYLDPERFERCLSRFLRSMKLFLSGFSEEGICMEGGSYWTYGFSNFTWFADLLVSYTNGRIDLFDDPKVETVASFMQKIFLKGNTTVSYSDGHADERVLDSLQYYLSCRYPQTVHLLPKESCICMWGNVQWQNLVRAFLLLPPEDAVRHKPLENYDFPSAQQSIVNGEKYSLFIKAGHNCEQHNHNDVGSFILATDHGQVLCDLGAGLYTREYFREETRYGIFCNSSFGHSVPIINGEGQKFGRAYAGTLVHKGDTLTVEMAGAYGQEALKGLRRRIRHTEDGIFLEDTVTGAVQLTERFITTVAPCVEAGCVRVSNVRLSFDPSLSPEIRTEVHVGHRGEETAVYCIDFAFPHGTERARFEFLVD